MVLFDCGCEQYDDAVSIGPASLVASGTGHCIFIRFRNFGGRGSLADGASRCIVKLCPTCNRSGVCNKPGCALRPGFAVLFLGENPGTADRFSSLIINYVVTALIFIGKILLSGQGE